jgi:pilus assembly protein Flp/PilA
VFKTWSRNLRPVRWQSQKDPKPNERTFKTKLGEFVMQKIISAFVEDESGATAIEYGLIAAIVGIGIIVGLGQVRDGLNGLFQNVETELAQ